MEKKIIMMSGPPASGKSTKARQIYESDKLKYVIVNRDSIRESRGDYWVPEQEDYITSLEVFAVKSALEKDLIPIIDATNLNPKTVQLWQNIAKEYNATIDFKPLYIPFKEALARDSKRDRPVGEKVLKSFYLRYFPDTFAEEMYTHKVTIAEPNTMLPSCIICDLDGTVALHQGRSPFEYNRVLEDKVDPRMALFLRTLNQRFPIIFITGREEKCREMTKQWIDSQIEVSDYKLYMRANGDYQHGETLKHSLYDTYIKGQYNVLAVFEDSSKCVEMWRKNGLLCCQVEDLNI